MNVRASIEKCPSCGDASAVRPKTKRSFGALWMVLCVISGCAQLERRLEFDRPTGELLASIKVIQGAFSGPYRRDTGFFFYLEEIPQSGPLLSVYEYRDGVVVDLVSIGTSETRTFLSTLTEIGFEPFDYESAVEQARIAKRRAGDELETIVLDGAEWEVMVSTQPGRFVLRKWNPAGDFRNYAAYSNEIAKLVAVMELLSAQYGKGKLGVL